MSEADEISELIADIAVRHNVSVGRDDPILILATVNQRLLEKTAATQDQLLKRFQSEIEQIASTWSDDATAKAQKLLGGAADEARHLLVELSKRNAESSADAIALKIRAEIETASVQIAQSVKAVRTMAIVTVVSALLVLATMLFLVLTAIR